ncbi:hypothetical protein MNBD_GAMMA20-1534 [hydrothermal vent metagenome]|uniref:Response regulator n=1 Tax=hydrothermal vent metagenome TaxID=652676 RepID=A0A3B1AHA7_9ZZZZ
MIRVLFVDDETAILEGLRNRLRSLRQVWQMAFATGAEAALAELSRREYDVIVTDMRMPGMDGATLLQRVRATYPQMVRIVLSGQTGKECLLRVLPIAHRFLAKPCETTDLEAAVERGQSLQARLNDSGIRQFVGAIGRLPALPPLYRELSEALEQSDTGLDKVAAIIEQDMSMTARLLQVANSAFCGRVRPTAHLRDAVTHMGLNAVRSLVLSAELFATLDTGNTLKGFSLSMLQTYSFRAARIAFRLLNNPAQANRTEAKTAFSAAMLHDIGHVVLATSLPAFYAPASALAKAEKLPLHVAEERVHGFSHAEIGAYLLDLWGLPLPIVEAVAHHHHPERAGEDTFGVTGAVHVADRLAHLDTDPQAGQNIDAAYLTDAGVFDKLPKWTTLARNVINEVERHG